jgi:hypothetical protein
MDQAMRESAMPGLPAPTKEGKCETLGAFAVGGSYGSQTSCNFVETGGGTNTVFPSRQRDVPPYSALSDQHREGSIHRIRSELVGSETRMARFHRQARDSNTVNNYIVRMPYYFG